MPALKAVGFVRGKADGFRAVGGGQVSSVQSPANQPVPPSGEPLPKLFLNLPINSCRGDNLALGINGAPPKNQRSR